MGKIATAIIRALRECDEQESIFCLLVLVFTTWLACVFMLLFRETFFR